MDVIERARGVGAKIITGASSDARARRKAEVSDALRRTIEAEIIPRLMLTHRAQADDDVPNAEAAVHLADLVLHQEVDIASAYVGRMRRRGLGVDAILLDLFAPAARRLGDDWLADRASFADVTIGLIRLHRLLNDVVASFDEAALRPDEPTMLLLPVSHEQHTFGLSMVAALLRRDGWAVSLGTGEADATRLVRRRRFDAVGFSASCELQLDGLARMIREVRAASRNPAVRVLVGGQLFTARPDLAAAVGADATAGDGRAACVAAEKLIASGET